MSFGHLAMQLIRCGETGKMVALHAGKYNALPVRWSGGVKRVDVPLQP